MSEHYETDNGELDESQSGENEETPTERVLGSILGSLAVICFVLVIVGIFVLRFAMIDEAKRVMSEQMTRLQSATGEDYLSELVIPVEESYVVNSFQDGSKTYDLSIPEGISFSSVHHLPEPGEGIQFRVHAYRIGEELTGEKPADTSFEVKASGLGAMIVLEDTVNDMVDLVVAEIDKQPFVTFTMNGIEEVIEEGENEDGTIAIRIIPDGLLRVEGLKDLPEGISIRCQAPLKWLGPSLVDVSLLSPKPFVWSEQSD